MPFGASIPFCAFYNLANFIDSAGCVRLQHTSRCVRLGQTRDLFTGFGSGFGQFEPILFVPSSATSAEATVTVWQIYLLIDQCTSFVSIISDHCVCQCVQTAPNLFSILRLVLGLLRDLASERVALSPLASSPRPFVCMASISLMHTDCDRMWSPMLPGRSNSSLLCC